MSFMLLVIYCLLIVLASLAGGWIPLLVRLTHQRLELAISFVSGAMLGVAWLEMVAAIGVAFMIALIGWKLTRESVEELVDTALSENYVANIQETIEKADGVHGVHSLRTRRMGSAVILDIHLQGY